MSSQSVVTKNIVVTLPVLPLREQVVFPGVSMSLAIGRPGSLALIEEVRRQGRHFVAVTQQRPEVEDPTPEELHAIGVEVELVQAMDLKDGRAAVIVRGLGRRRLESWVRTGLYYEAAAIPVEETEAAGGDVDALAAELYAVLEELAARTGKRFADAGLPPAGLVDLSAASLEMSAAERVALLEELSVAKRLRAVTAMVRKRLEVWAIKDRLEAESERGSPARREEILRERMQSILDELGEAGDEQLPELAQKIREAQMPAEVEEVARRQLRRLQGLQDGSPEQSVTRTYLEWLVELPWSKRSEDKIDLGAARAVLDGDHHGLEPVKKRMLEYLAVRKLRPRKKGPILCLVGPPGVGKTSLGRSIANALGRQFVRISLGGVHDESEIRGHRRTYVGALPGRIIQALKRAGTRNPVFVLDEVDKLRADFRGDPSAALLEVLDPEQNSSFSDHYLEVPFDLSEVIFIATANDLGAIPGPLRDRMEIIAIPGYPLVEKRYIAERHLVPKQLREHGLEPGAVTFAPGSLEALIERYTREAGVRNLEREIANVVRGVAVKVAVDPGFRAEVRVDELADWLGPARYERETAGETQQPGVATGLAWTPTGGEILFVEVTRMPGHGKLVLTGQLGEVMKESAQAALSFVRSHGERWGIAPLVFEESDLHVHVPAGATPKDGPSAGNALVTAIVSLLTGRRVRGEVAMTGEITLRGTVLPVGGIAAKVLAAHRAGVRKVILPERNAKDLVEVPAEVRDALEIVLVKKVDETLAAALDEEVAAPVEPVFWPLPSVVAPAIQHAA
jgi:ATP-dependent Lon protease